MLTPDDGIQTLNVPFPLPENWDRFETYARRVRTLNFDVSPSTGNAVCRTTFRTIAQFRPPGKILLPNLLKFTYNAGKISLKEALLPFLIFLGPSIAELELRDPVPGGVGDFLAHVAHSAPHVHTLTIEGDEISDADSAALETSLLRLEKLETLRTSSTRLTPTTWNAIAQHPCLTYAAFDAQGWGYAAPSVGIQPGAFEKLGRLAIRASFDFLCSLLEPQHELSALTRVVLEGGSMGQGRSGFRRLCELLVQKLPNLSLVRLACHSNAVRDDKALELGDFRPFLRCENLRYFHLSHPCGVSVTVSEIGELLDAWPGIKMLSLEYAPYCVDSVGSIHSIKWTPPTLPLNVLDTIARKRPKIRQLGLVLDATAPIKHAPTSLEPQFECLDELKVSLSSVGHPAEVASFLARRSKTPFALKFEVPSNIYGHLRQRLQDDKKKWDQIQEHLQLLCDQKERLEEEFRLRLQVERTRHMQELREVMASTQSISEDE